MNPSEAFEKVRADYFRVLESCLEEIRETHPDAVSEVLVEFNTPNLPRPYRLMRPDILYKKEAEPQIVKIECAEGLLFEPIDLVLTSGASMKVYPFQWDYMKLHLVGDVPDWLPFEAWVGKWLDVEDIRSSSSVDFAGLIHQVSQPIQENGIWTLCIDMGSAGLDALNELIELLGRLPLKMVQIGELDKLREATLAASASIFELYDTEEQTSRQ